MFTGMGRMVDYERAYKDQREVALRLETKLRVLESAARAVLAMEGERVNLDKNSEPYDPIANPGQFDERIVALALALLPETDWRIDSLCCAMDEENPDG